jgi:hypothetical protein
MWCHQETLPENRRSHGSDEDPARNHRDEIQSRKNLFCVVRGRMRVRSKLSVRSLRCLSVCLCVPKDCHFHICKYGPEVAIYARRCTTSDQPSAHSPSLRGSIYLFPSFYSIQYTSKHSFGLLSLVVIRHTRTEVYYSCFYSRFRVLTSPQLGFVSLQTYLTLTKHRESREFQAPLKVVQ